MKKANVVHSVAEALLMKDRHSALRFIADGYPLTNAYIARWYGISLRMTQTRTAK